MGKKGFRIAAGVGMAVGAISLINDVRKNPQQAGPIALWRLTGYDINSGSFDIKNATALLPMVGGCAVSMIASKVGLNRYTPKGINI